MNDFLSRTLDKNTEVNFIAHSMGGLDCRHLITHINPMQYRPISLTTLSTPHRGSSFMDFCRDYLGLGRISSKKGTTSKSSTKANVEPLRINTTDKPNKFDATTSLSSTILTHTMLARTLDTPAYANLTTSFLQNTFNPMTPDSANVEYFSFGAVIPKPPTSEEDNGLPIWHPLYLPHKVVTEREGRENDGLVSIKSARWGKFVGQLACDHWVRILMLFLLISNL
jgi:triacylglycerol lipase